MTVSPEQIQIQKMLQADPAYWAQYHRIRLVGGTFSFDKHQHQYKPMRSEAKRACCMKGTQLGWTECFGVLPVLHGLIYRRFPQGVLYLFPTADNVQEFSKARFTPLIQANPESIGKYVKVAGKGTDTASLKKIGDSFLYLRGARLSQAIEGGVDEKQSVQLLSIPVDRVVFDEVDAMDETAIPKALARMAHSELKEERYLGNPTIPGMGIDAKFQESDQQHWQRKCQACGTWTCAEKSFPNCVKLRENGTGYIGCDKCGREVPVWAGLGSAEWAPDYPSRTVDMEGYHLSQLSSAFVDPAEVLRDFENPSKGNITDVYRLRLGLPYVPVEDQLRTTAVYACCGPDLMPMSWSGSCAMGVDTGKPFYVVILIRTDRERWETLRITTVGSWEMLHDLQRRYNVRSTVIDILPYEDGARTYQAGHPGTWLCQYTENPSDVVWDDGKKLVRVNRTQIFDWTHRIIAEKQIVLPRRSPVVEEFAKQCCAPAKQLETNKKTGTQVYRYRERPGADDYRNALNYAILASQKVAISVHSRTVVKRKAKTEYAII